MAFLDVKKLARGLNRQALEAYWMPFTGNRMFKDDPRMIVGAEGCSSPTTKADRYMIHCPGFGVRR